MIKDEIKTGSATNFRRTGVVQMWSGSISQNPASTKSRNPG
jgi:hypothetical protein